MTLGVSHHPSYREWTLYNQLSNCIGGNFPPFIIVCVIYFSLTLVRCQTKVHKCEYSYFV